MKRATLVTLIANLMVVLSVNSASAESSGRTGRSEQSAVPGKIKLKLKSTSSPAEKAESKEEPPPGDLPETESGLDQPTTGFIPEEAQRPSRKIFTVLNYPQFDGSISYSPSFTGFKQTTPVTVNGVTSDYGYDISGYSFVNLSGGLSAKLSARALARMHFNYFSFQADEVKAASASDVSILKSKTSVFTPTIEAQYCFFISDGRRRICPGASLGVDSFLVLQYVGSTSLELSTISDTMWGPYVEFETPIIPTVTGRALLGYEFGLKSGSNTPKTISSDSKIRAKFAAEFPFRERTVLVANFDIDYRNAEFTTSLPTRTVQDKFKSVSTTYGLGFGVRRDF